MFYRPIFLVECQAFASILRIILSWIELAALLMVSLKLDGVLELSWYSCFWPIWVGVSLLSLLSIGELLLLLSSLCCSLLRRRVHLLDLIAPVWLFYCTFTASSLLFYLFYTVASVLEGGNYDLFFPVSLMLLNTLIFIFLTRLTNKWLVYWWDSFFTNSGTPQAVQPEPEVQRSFKPPPRLLARISTIYYKPISIKEYLRTRTRRNLSLTVASAAVRSQVLSHSFHEVSDDSSISVEVSHYGPERTCILCCENPPNSVLMDCGHGGLCYTCAMDLRSQLKTCHICRSPIRSVLELAEPNGKISHVISIKS